MKIWLIEISDFLRESIKKIDYTEWVCLQTPWPIKGMTYSGGPHRLAIT